MFYKDDHSMTRVVISTSLALLMLLFSSTFALAAPPSQPSNLNHLVYSKSAAEIFWDRPTTFGLTYEITRDGQVLEATDGVSYYDNQLSAGTSYNYQVTAINLQGERSTPASVNFDTQGGTQPPTNIATPTGLRASVYSKKSAELFWDRTNTFGLTYEIARDGQVLKTTDGVSYYDNQLNAGTSYDYQVIAINLQGERSAPGLVSLSTLGDTGTGGTTTPVVAAPTGLRATVYSKRTAELFWNRPTTFGLNYEITRGSQVLKTTDGVSYYDSQLSAGTSYTYQVVAINQTGQRSQPGSVMLNTPSGTTTDDSSPITFALNQSPAAAIVEPDDYYQRNGYGNLDVIRVDIKTVTTPGTCIAGDRSGCTLADLLGDIDKRDDLKVEIAVHFQSDDFADDGSVSNATMRMRGSGSRLGSQKSFRIKLDSKEELWRNERYVQLNKSPFDSSRIRNKLAFDTMSEIPHLPSIRTQYVNLWIDDGNGPVDQGLYHHVERINKNYLKNRGFDTEGNLYDAEDFQFELSDLSDCAVNEDGTPKNEDFFESALSINAGEDHRPLVAMLTALHDPERTFESVLDQYFDQNNVMTWMAANILLHQYDAVRHNYYLFNPAGSEKFYFLPWDYDEALETWKEPPNDYEQDSLRQREIFGYAVGEPNVFISKFYRLPGMHEQMIAAVEYIRQNHLTDSAFAEKADRYIRIAEPFQLRAPDNEFNPWFNVASAEKFARGPSENVEALKTRFSIPMPPTLNYPVLQGSEWRFSWKPAYDVTGNSISYELQVSRSPSFEPDNLVVNLTGIDDAVGTVEQGVGARQLPSGTYYARLTARASNEPFRFWSVSLNRLEQDGARYYGVIRFSVP